MILIDILCVVFGFIADCIKDLIAKNDMATAFVGTLYLLSFFCLIICVVKLGLNGEPIWGFGVLLSAVVIGTMSAILGF